MNCSQSTGAPAWTGEWRMLSTCLGAETERGEMPINCLTQSRAIERLGQVTVHAGFPALLFGTLHRIGPSTR